MSFPVPTISMRPTGWTAVLLCANCLSLGAQNPAVPPQTPGTASQSARADTDFADARRLLQQGRYDEAVSQLSDLAVKNPALKGLSFELGAASDAYK